MFPRSAVHSALISVAPGPPGRVVLGPEGWDDAAAVVAGAEWADDAPIACVQDARGNVVDDGAWEVLLEVVGPGWARDFSTVAIAGYADFGAACVVVPSAGEYRCVASLKGRPDVAGSTLARVHARPRPAPAAASERGSAY